MTYNFTDRLDRLGQRMSEVNGEQVYYCDNLDDPSFYVTLDGVSRGATECQEFQLQGPSSVSRLIDFFVNQTELDKVGLNHRPSEGHHIKDSRGRTYQVVSGPGGQPAVCPTTPSEKRLRIHTSQVT